MIEWVSLSDTPPPMPETPYETYLVWLRSHTGTVRNGIARTVQFSRDTGWFLEHQLTGLIPTHWAPINGPAD